MRKWMMNATDDEAYILRRMVFTHETTLHMTGCVQSYSCRIWGTEKAPYGIYMHVRDSTEVNKVCGKIHDAHNFNMEFTWTCYKNVSFHTSMERNEKKMCNFVSRRRWRTPLHSLSTKISERQISQSVGLKRWTKLVARTHPIPLTNWIYFFGKDL
jgi:hypothetical protein